MIKQTLIKIITIATLTCGLCNFYPAEAATRGKTYKAIYDESPVNILVLPVTNLANEKECNAYFENTADSILIEKGYVVYRNDQKDINLKNIKVDASFETVIKTWHKSNVEGLFEVEIQYFLISCSTGDTLFAKEGHLTVNSYQKLGGGRLVNIIATSIKSMTMNKGWIGKTCCSYLLSDLPEGKYGVNYMKDKKKKSSKSVVHKKIKCLTSK